MNHMIKTIMAWELIGLDGVIGVKSFLNIHMR